jgi:hypothetical protein
MEGQVTPLRFGALSLRSGFNHLRAQAGHCFQAQRRLREFRPCGLRGLSLTCGFVMGRIALVRYLIESAGNLRFLAVDLL